MSAIRPGQSFSKEILGELTQMRGEMDRMRKGPAESGPSKTSFSDHLMDSIKQVDSMQKTADTMATDLVSGKSENIHETMLAASHAELSFNLMVQIRNKGLEAYQEVMRMQV